MTAPDRFDDTHEGPLLEVTGLTTDFLTAEGRVRAVAAGRLGRIERH